MKCWRKPFDIGHVITANWVLTIITWGYIWSIMSICRHVRNVNCWPSAWPILSCNVRSNVYTTSTRCMSMIIFAQVQHSVLFYPSVIPRLFDWYVTIWYYGPKINQAVWLSPFTLTIPSRAPKIYLFFTLWYCMVMRARQPKRRHAGGQAVDHDLNFLKLTPVNSINSSPTVEDSMDCMV
jgi:hypothetical protein